VGFGLGDMDVTGRRNVVILLAHLLAADCQGEFLLVLPRLERFGYAVDAGGGDEILRIAFLNHLAGVDQEDLVLAVLWLGLIQEQKDTGGAGVVEQVRRQVDDAFDQILLDEPLPDAFFFVLVGGAATAGRRASVEDNRGPTGGVQRGEDVLGPAPVGRLSAREAGPLRESAPARRRRNQPP
jgi:hypothetical protein